MAKKKTAPVDVSGFVKVPNAPILYVDFPSSEQVKVESKEGDTKSFRYELSDIQMPKVGQIVWRLNRSTWSDKYQFLPGTTDEEGNLINGIKPPQPYEVTAILHAETRRVSVVLVGPKEKITDAVTTDPNANASSGS